MLLQPADALAFGLRHIEPQQIAFVFCIEGTGIEQQALLLCESVRAFAGRYRRSPILVVSPRPEVPIAESSRKQLARLGVEHVVAPLNRTNSPYLPINRLVAGAWAEQKLTADYIATLDSDMLMVSEPIFYCCDAGVRPADVKGSASLGSGDLQDAYWRHICRLAGITIDQIPLLRTTVDNALVRASFNAGFSVVRRSRGILGKTAAVFFESFRAGLKPLPGWPVNIRASTGPVGPAASEFWGSSQAVLSAAIASLAQDTLIYSARYNVPLHLLEGGRPRPCRARRRSGLDPLPLAHAARPSPRPHARLGAPPGRRPGPGLARRKARGTAARHRYRRGRITLNCVPSSTISNSAFTG